jgi:3-isopropylmalate/(R)-2-methylmalate dehydratase large subunit
MGLTITEKILARHCGREQVFPGEFINVDVDVALANELSAQLSIVEFEDIEGAERVWDPEKIIIIPDHFTPAKDIRTAELVKKVREFALKHGAVWYESGTVGIEHVVLLERGFVAPGDVVIGGDSHTVTYGGIGAFATGAGSTDIAAIWALGEFWMRVPESIKIVYTGTRKPWVSAKDIILYTIGEIGVDGAIYGALEYAGPVVEAMPAHERFTMANMAIECGAKSGIVPPDEIAWAYYAEHAGQAQMEQKRAALGDIASDPDARYAQVVELDISALEPLVAYPHLPENVKPISVAAAEDVKLDQVLIGYCTNGWIEDLRIAAEVMKGRRIAPHTRAVITPGSQQVYIQALKEGLITTFAEAGCTISPSSCGACIGGHLGVIASGERSLTTTNRNFRGRGGALEGEIYMASPAVAAASAVLGRLGSPEEL